MVGLTSSLLKGIVACPGPGMVTSAQGALEYQQVFMVFMQMRTQCAVLPWSGSLVSAWGTLLSGEVTMEGKGSMISSSLVMWL